MRHHARISAVCTKNILPENCSKPNNGCSTDISQSPEYRVPFFSKLDEVEEEMCPSTVAQIAREVLKYTEYSNNSTNISK